MSTPETLPLVAFLRDKAVAARRQAASRRDMALVERSGTEADNEAARLMAERMSGRAIPRRSVTDRERAAKMHDAIGDKVEREAEQFEAAADALSAAFAAGEAAERERQSRIEFDNHHNALVCAYCNPQRLKFTPATPVGWQNDCPAPTPESK